MIIRYLLWLYLLWLYLLWLYLLWLYSLWRTALHDHLLDLRGARGRLHRTGEGEPVGLERGVVARRVGIALARARGRVLRWAAGRALGRVRVVALRPVVVAVRQGEGRAPTATERAGAVVVAAGDHAVRLDVGPRRRDLTAIASGGEDAAGVEADVVGREGHLELRLGGDAHAVRRGLRAAEGPAAAAVRLVADVVERLATGRPVRGRVE